MLLCILLYLVFTIILPKEYTPFSDKDTDLGKIEALNPGWCGSAYTKSLVPSGHRAQVVSLMHVRCACKRQLINVIFFLCVSPLSLSSSYSLEKYKNKNYLKIEASD